METKQIFDRSAKDAAKAFLFKNTFGITGCEKEGEVLVGDSDIVDGFKTCVVFFFCDW